MRTRDTFGLTVISAVAVIAATALARGAPFVKPPRVTVDVSEYVGISKTVGMDELVRAGVDAVRPPWSHGPTLFLSLSGTSNAQLRPWRKYNGIGEAMVDDPAGLFVLMPVIERARQLGYTAVVFQGLTGYHPTVDAQDRAIEPNNTAMPFWIASDLPKRWREQLPRWCEAVRAMGVEPGVYVGTVAIPNTGTQASPRHHWIERRHIPYIVGAMRDIESLGFGFAGLDAINWIWAFRDQPAGRIWQASDRLYGLAVPPRDPGIGLALLDAIVSDQRLTDFDLMLEAPPPQGAPQGYGVNAQVVRSRNSQPVPDQPVWSDVDAPVIERILCRGASFMLLANGDGDDPRTSEIEGWTWAELQEFRRHCESIGVEHAATSWTLYSMGRLDLPTMPSRSVR